MHSILDNPRFAQAYQRLAGVSLNPRRHTASNALEHSEAVAARAVALAEANGCTPAEVQLLANLSRAHDIGKITGTAKPERSLELLAEHGVADRDLLALVGRHDTNLPWYIAARKGQPPSDKAWRRLAAEVDLRLLCIFMVADRADAPPGWRRNAPVVWFLEQARRRVLEQRELVLDLDGVPSEISAGGAVVRQRPAERGAEVLVIRVRAEGYELPKGGIEWDELPADAAIRETREETGALSELEVGRELEHLDYAVGSSRHAKRVRYFVLRPVAELRLGPLPARTHERRWVRREELASIPLVNDALRSRLAAALAD